MMKLFIAFKEIPKGFFNDYLGLFDNQEKMFNTISLPDFRFVSLEYKPTQTIAREVKSQPYWLIRRDRVERIWVDFEDDNYWICFNDNENKPDGKPFILTKWDNSLHKTKEEAESALLRVLNNRLGKISIEYDNIKESIGRVCEDI